MKCKQKVHFPPMISWFWPPESLRLWTQCLELEFRESRWCSALFLLRISYLENVVLYQQYIWIFFSFAYYFLFFIITTPVKPTFLSLILKFWLPPIFLNLLSLTDFLSTLIHLHWILTPSRSVRTRHTTSSFCWKLSSDKKEPRSEVLMKTDTFFNIPLQSASCLWRL